MTLIGTMSDEFKTIKQKRYQTEIGREMSYSAPWGIHRVLSSWAPLCLSVGLSSSTHQCHPRWLSQGQAQTHQFPPHPGSSGTEVRVLGPCLPLQVLRQCPAGSCLGSGSGLSHPLPPLVTAFLRSRDRREEPGSHC